MRPNVREFVACAAQAWRLPGPVFEFGSFQVEGQEGSANLRELFPGREYVGCDMRQGPGVDRLEDLGRLSIADQSVGTVICVDTLEHVFEAPRAVDEMLRVLAPGGFVLFSAPFAFRLHHYPDDYWRISPSCMARLLAPLAASWVGWQGEDKNPHTVFGLAARGPLQDRFFEGLPEFERLIAERLPAVPPPASESRWWRRLTGQVFRTKSERAMARRFQKVTSTWNLPSPKFLLGKPLAGNLGGRVDLSAS